MQNQRLFGQIFTPDNPENKITGVWLNIENNTIFIEAPFNAFGDKNWKILLGEFNGLDKVTFLNIRTGGGSSGYGGSWRKLYVSTIIKGKHFHSEKELAFKKITLTSPAMAKWIRLCGGIKLIEPDLYQIPHNKEIFSINFEDINISASIGHMREFSSSNLNIEKNCYWVIESKNSKDLFSFSEIMRKIKKWILFVTNKNPEFSDYSVTDENDDHFELVNTLRDLNDSRFTQNLALNFQDVKSSIENMLYSWLEKEKLESIVELIQEKEYNTELSFQSYFLNMCVAIESLDFIFGVETINPKIESRTQDRQKISFLIKDEQLRENYEKESMGWLRSTYRERLKKYKNVFKSIMGNTFKRSPSDFLSKIVNTRNSLAHNGTYKEHLTHVELLLFGKVIEFVIKHEILKLLNYEISSNEKILLESKRHVEILARLNEYKK